MKSEAIYIQDMRLELAKAEDLADIVAIYNQAIVRKTATAELIPTTVQEKQAWFNEHLQDTNRPIYVLKKHPTVLKDNRTAGQSVTRVVAWASYSDLFKRVAYRISSELSIYIHDDYQGRGLGKAMVEKVLTKASDIEVNNVLVKVFAHNKASLKLFERFGFEQWGYLPAVCDMDGFIADIVIMGKTMGNDVH